MSKSNPTLSSIIPSLLSWYPARRRALPWRTDPTPYHVWLSEIMLQQTRIEAVIPYYHRFLEAFPDVASLANADDDRLMKLWEGLGYYSRARNLKKAAEAIVRDHGGTLPKTADALRKLAGIGDYTAGAIASIAFGEPEPAVDGNVLRVITRVLACDDDITLGSTKKAITEALRTVYPSGKDASDLTQALMELGEEICIPNGRAKCELCPIREHCRAHAEGTVERFPVKAPKKPRRQEKLTVLLLSCRGKYAIRKRPRTGLLSALWEYPNASGWMDETTVAALLRENAIETVSVVPIGEAVHIFTHVEWHMHGYAAECTAEHPDLVWRTPAEILSDYAIPTAFRAYTARLKEEF